MANTPDGRLRLRRFYAQAGVQIPDTTHSNVALGARYDFGSQGGCVVDDLWLDRASGLVWFVVRPTAPGGELKTFFFKCSGSGEPLVGADLERHLKRLESEGKGKVA